MWEKLADGVTKDQLLTVVLKNATAYENIRLSWEKNGLVHMCSLDVLDNVNNEDLEEVDDFTLWATKKQYPDKRPNHLKNLKNYYIIYM